MRLCGEKNIKMESKNKQVAERIVAILRGGLTLSEDTQHYIDSTFSNPSVSLLSSFIGDVIERYRRTKSKTNIVNITKEIIIVKLYIPLVKPSIFTVIAVALSHTSPS